MALSFREPVSPKPPPSVEYQYEYVIKPAAVETLVNLLLRNGIDLRANHYDPLEDLIIFSSDRLINVKILLEQGTVSSYTISKVMKSKEIIERR